MLRENLASFNKQRISYHLIQKGTKWYCNPPTVSHMEFIWERMIRLVRRIMKAMLGEQVVTDKLLLAVMDEVESILNSRPITKLSLDPHDEELTLNHILLLRLNTSNSPGVFSVAGSYGRRRWKQAQYMADQFWFRWLKLQLGHKWNLPYRNFKVGYLVLVVSENAPCCPDKEGMVRQVEVKVCDNILERPIVKLCLLEGAHGYCQLPWHLVAVSQVILMFIICLDVVHILVIVVIICFICSCYSTVLGRDL